MAQYVVFTIGRDRPGIVAAVTQAILDVGGNLLDSSMTVLSGHFAVALAVDATVDAAALEQSLASLENHLDLDITVREITVRDDTAGIAEPESDDPDYVVSVYGADRPGIVARFTGLLADRSINVTDLNTRLVGDPLDPVYAMLLEVRLAPERVTELHAALAATAAELGVEASLHLAEADVF